MKKFVKLLAISLVVAMLMGMTSSLCMAASNQEFPDVPRSHWAYDYVGEMVGEGIVSGYSDGTFKPTNNVTRAEWAKLFTCTAEVPEYDNYELVIENAALDVDCDDWYSPYLVSMLPYFEFDTNVEDNGKIFVTFKPNKKATRLEIVKSIIIQKGFDLSDPDYTLITGFSDYESIPEGDKKYVAVAVEQGIITGFSDNTFKPHNNISRAEAVTVLYRAYIKEKDDSSKTIKPYTISKLVSAKIDEGMSIMATLDDEQNFYCIDSAKNCVYKIDLEERKKILYFDANTLEEEIDGKKYSSYKARQIFFDKEQNLLLLNGIYTEVAQPGKVPQKNAKETFIYDVSQNDNVELFTKLEDHHPNELPVIQMVLDNEFIAAHEVDLVKFDVESGEDVSTFSGITHNSGNGNVVYQLYKNNIYYFAFRSGSDEAYSSVYKYDFGKSRFGYLIDNTTTLRNSAMGVGEGCYYFWDERDEQMYKFSLESMYVEEVEITLNPDYIDVKDMAGFDSLSKLFYVVNEDAIIFYDTSTSAFRILEKSDDSNGRIAVEYFVDEDFYYDYEMECED